MRVIAGSAKGTKLFVPSRANLRPTSGRTKQILFDTLLSLSPLPKLVVDLFAGSGALGIEALSRGVCDALFVEKSAQMTKALFENLRRTNFVFRAEIIRADALKYLRDVRHRHFPLILADPPYGGLQASALLALAAHSCWLPAQGVLVLEASRRTRLEIPAPLALLQLKQAGETAIYFIGKDHN